MNSSNIEIDDDQSVHNDQNNPNDLDSISETQSVTSSNKRNSFLFGSRRSSIKNDLVPLAMIRPIDDNYIEVTSLCINKSGDLICVTWNNHLTCIYTLSSNQLNNNVALFHLKTFSYNISKYIIISNCFHSHEPILLQYVQLSSKSTSKLRMLSLLTNKLFCLNDDDISSINPVIGNNQLVDIKCSTNTGRFVLAFSSINNTKKSLIYVVLTVSQLYQSIYCINQSITTSLAVPPNAYIDGDHVILTKEPKKDTTTTNIRSSWPLLLVVKPTGVTLGTEDQPVISYTHHIFRSCISFNNQNLKSPNNNYKFTEYLGILLKDLSDNLFIPNEIQVNKYNSGWIPDINDIENADLITWEALLYGNSIKLTSHDETSNYSSLIYLIKYNNKSEKSLSFEKTLYRDADFWSTEAFQELNPLEISSGLLTLDTTGTHVSWVPLHSNLAPNNLLTKSLPQEMANLWTSPIGKKSYVIYSTTIHDFNKQCQSLIKSTESNYVIPENPIKFTFLHGEIVFDVLWQSTPKAINDRTNDEERKVWFTSNEGLLIGIRTNLRILILSSNLVLLNEHIHTLSKQPLKPHLYGSWNDPCTSISWVGCALVYVTESGVVSYILPIRSLYDISMKPIELFTQQKLHSVGLNANDYKKGNLIFLSKMICLNSGISLSLRIIGCLPGRLIIGLSNISNINNEIDVITVPITFVEPICLGLLIKFYNISSSLSVDPINNERILALAKMASLYFPWGRPSSNSSKSMSYPSSHVTNKLAIAFDECGYYHLAALVCGLPPMIDSNIPKSLQYNNASPFPQLRWVSNVVKFHISVKAKRSHLSGPALLSGIPLGGHEVVDGFIDGDTFSGILPHRCSFLSISCATASRILMMHGFIDDAIKFADIAGDEKLLLTLLCQKDNYPTISETIGPNLNVWKNAVSQEKYDELLSTEINNRPKTYTDMKDLYDMKRRSTLLSMSKENNNHSSQNDDINVELSIIIKVLTSEIVKEYGPPSILGKLAADCVEDWLGLRVVPDILNETTNESLFTAITKNNNIINKSIVTNQNNSNSVDLLPKGLAKRPETWVDGIGNGSKDNETCLGYWRFSDFLNPSSSTFLISTNSKPYTRINFIDLSKFGSTTMSTSGEICHGLNILELYSNNFSDIELDHSKSPVDYGEEHEKTKVLFDVCYKGIKDCGMRMTIGRGGPLDIGLLHLDPLRNKLSVEFHLYQKPQTFQSNVILLQRISGSTISPFNSSGNQIYCLYIDISGYLVWCFGELSNGNSLKSQDKIFGLDSEEQWYHIAFSIETQNSQSNVYVYVNSNEVSNSTLTIPSSVLSLDEKNLELSTLYFSKELPNGWKVTEFRIWAEIRNSENLEENKEIYLSMASKRRRQQRSMKGTKELFSLHLLEDLTLPSDELVIRSLDKLIDTSKISLVNFDNSSSDNPPKNEISKLIVPKPTLIPLKSDFTTITQTKRVNFNELSLNVSENGNHVESKFDVEVNQPVKGDLETNSAENTIKSDDLSSTAPLAKPKGLILGSLPPTGAPRVRQRLSQQRDENK